MNSLMNRSVLLCGLLFCSGLLQSRASTIDWGSAVGDLFVDSNNNALTSSFIFELGSFGSFIPTSSNQTDWLSNWKVFDRAQAPGSSGWNPSPGNPNLTYLSSSATLLTGGYSSETSLPPFTFAAGEQAYIFVYNRLDLDLGSEWALITNNASDGNQLDDWLMPAPGGKTDFPIEWRLSNASAVLYGGVNDIQGPGVYTVDPGSFALQTHAVPEPAGMLLLFLSVAARTLFVRRRLA